MIDRSKWEWFGHAGHLVVGRWCRFHLATLVGDYWISTVGEYWPNRDVREIHAEVHDPAWLAANRQLRGEMFDTAYAERFGFEQIGHDRLYETMVFKVGPNKCDTPECGCGMPEPESWSELDCAGYNNAGEATRGHYAMCEKWASSIPEIAKETA